MTKTTATAAEMSKNGRRAEVNVNRVGCTEAHVVAEAVLAAPPSE